MLYLVTWVTKEVIEASENISLFVRTIVSDMGAANRDIWKVAGIQSNRTNIQNFIAHPCRLNSLLYFMADSPHMAALEKS